MLIISCGCRRRRRRCFTRSTTSSRYRPSARPWYLASVTPVTPVTHVTYTARLVFSERVVVATFLVVGRVKVLDGLEVDHRVSEALVRLVTACGGM